MNGEQYGDALGAAMREIMRLDAENEKLRADKTLMHGLIAGANEHIRVLTGERDGLEAVNTELVTALASAVKDLDAIAQTSRGDYAKNAASSAHDALIKLKGKK